jgi:hypothetical protein
MSQPRRTVPAWIFVGALFVLGVLQYRWIGEVSRAERERLRATLRAALDGLGRDFDSEIAADCLALLPAGAIPGTQAAETQMSARYLEWKRTTVHGRVFRRVAIAPAGPGPARLRMMDLETGTFKDAIWPAEWEYMRGRIEGGLIGSMAGVVRPVAMTMGIPTAATSGCDGAWAEITQAGNRIERGVTLGFQGGQGIGYLKRRLVMSYKKSKTA